jgi:endonuclease/exonuclease/phosphatase family metal-dependent hydrolase
VQRLLAPLAFVLFAVLSCKAPARTGKPEAPRESSTIAATVKADRRTLTFLTYNVLGDAAAKAERFPRLLDILREADADVVALQEVRPWSLELLWNEPWVRERYEGTTAAGEPFVARGLYILSKLPFEDVAWKLLPGSQLRMVLVARLRVDGRSLAVGDVHLESPLRSSRTRATQLAAVFPMLEGADDAVILGDFNFGDGEEPETSCLDERYADLWIALRPGGHGFTWNIEKSPMARAGSFRGEASRRLDRILLRSSHWRPKSVRIVGDEPVTADGKVFPSDHFGLVATLVRD